ncbi:STAS domain-containing protein [Streptomyces sp. NBC_01217]|uniref:STAS domain-containing protein n=1 Tax=Streptomyces sp. NBC_01217 TaxID=2903779 RepID=UPI002E0D9CC1|nr:STAS domain-containing protein [Streptomyces sp. NBC_01217]
MHRFRSLIRWHRPGRDNPPHGHTVVRLHGDLDARNADATSRRLVRLIDTGVDVLEVDLADVQYLSPDGCAAFFAALRTARVRGGRLVITHASDHAQSVLHQIGLSRALSEQDG